MSIGKTVTVRRASFIVIAFVIAVMMLMMISTTNVYAQGSENQEVNNESEDSKDNKTIIDAISNAPIAETINQVAEEGDVSYYALTLEGRQVAAFEKERDAKAVIEIIEDHFAQTDIEGAVVSMEPELIVKKVRVDSKDEYPEFDDVNAVVTYLVKGDGDLIHFTSDDDTLWGIAETYGVDVDEVIKLNPNIDPEVLTGDTRVIVQKAQPLVKIIIEYDELVEKKIKFKTVEEETEDLYEGDTEVYQEGYNGLALATEHVVLVNGEEYTRKETDREILEEAQDEIILVGTAEKPEEVVVEEYEETYEESEESYAKEDAAAAIASIAAVPVSDGSLAWPVSGTVTYGFGYRSAPAYGASTYHEGIDICAPYGTPIYAAESGKVTLSSWYSGYGYAVIIDHGNGMTTLYGHCSSLAVSAGQYVERGQVIAYVGSTGISSANHCHFEVRVGGSAVNPYNYL
jgi:murein DD-endopeptidase MepM/ murein hydrolase activator NlpD